MSRIGKNVIRNIGNPGINRNITEEISNVRRFGQTPTLQRAVAIDVIIDPNLLSDEQVDLIKDTVNNPEFASIMPVNSVLARMVSTDQGTIERTNTILFPFFSSHFMLPVQPGEIVEVIYDDYFGGGNGIGYWITRTSSERTVEDVNYTHLDRRFDLSMNPSNFTTSDRSNRNEIQPEPGFPNGGNTLQTLTLAVSSSKEKPYERIVQNATAYFNKNNGLQGIETNGETSLVTPEPVPRWRKRPQEFVLQGSNNTLICLGEDRKGSPLGALVANEGQSTDAKNQAGTIDIVSGRGRVLPSDPTVNPEQQRADTERSPTAPLTTLNTRETSETDKAPYRRIQGAARLKDNPIEGDPDFREDAARLYISMQTEADTNFGLTDIKYTENTTPITQPNERQQGTINKSYVVGKADHIRLIARSDLSSQQSRGIDGTIAIIREGNSEDKENGLGLIYIDKTGIQLDAPRINLGRGLANVAAADGNPTPGGEPYIRWSKFRDTVKRLQEEMDAIRANLEAQIDTVATELQNTRIALATNFQASNCVPYSPDPALTAAAAQLQPAGAGGSPGMNVPNQNLTTQRTNLDSNLNNARQNTTSDVDNSKSNKIFGE